MRSGVDARSAPGGPLTAALDATSMAAASMPFDPRFWEELPGSDGAAYVPRRTMPRVPDEMLECACYLYRSPEEAREGVGLGGTAFAVSMPPASPHLWAIRWIHLVTCKHVIDGDHAALVARINTAQGVQVVKTRRADWTVHPDGDDLAVCPIGLKDDARLREVPIGLLLDEFRARLLRIGPGDDTFEVGRFVNHEGRRRNTPTVRCGTIAMMPVEQVPMADGHMQDAYLVESRTRSGYSGSPVFVRAPHDRLPPLALPNREGPLPQIPHGYGPSTPLLLGVLAAYLQGPNAALPDLLENTGMEVVIPAWRLLLLLETPELASRRDREEAQRVRKAGTPAMPAARIGKDKRGIE